MQMTNEFIREINAYYLPLKAVLVCANLIVIPWDMPKPPQVHQDSGMFPKPSAPQLWSGRLTAVSPTSCVGFCASKPISRAANLGGWHIPLPHHPCPGLTLHRVPARYLLVVIATTLWQPTGLVEGKQISFLWPLTFSPLPNPTPSTEAGDACCTSREQGVISFVHSEPWSPSYNSPVVSSLSGHPFSFISESYKNSQGFHKETLNLWDGVIATCILSLLFTQTLWLQWPRWVSLSRVKPTLIIKKHHLSF